MHAFITKHRFKLIHLFQEMMFYTPILTLYLVKHEVGLQDIIISQSIYTIAMLLAEIPTGVLADKFGQKWSTSWGMLFYALGYASLLLFPSTFITYFMNALWGIGGAFVSGSLEALVYEDYHAGKKPSKNNGYQQYYSRLNMFGRIGAVVSALVAGILLQFMGETSYKIAVFLTMASYVAGLVLVRWYRPIGRTSSKQSPEKSDSHMAEILHQGFSAVASNKWLVAITLFTVLTLNGQYLLRSAYPLVFEMQAIPPLFIGLALSLANIGNASLLFVLSKLKQELPLVPSLVTLALLEGILFVSISLAHSWGVVIAFLLLGSIFDIDRVIISNFANRHLPDTVRSTGLSFMSFVRSIAQTLMRIGLGVMTGALGLIATLQFTGGYLLVGGVVSAVVFGFVVEKKNKH